MFKTLNGASLTSRIKTWRFLLVLRPNYFSSSQTKYEKSSFMFFLFFFNQYFQ